MSRGRLIPSLNYRSKGMIDMSLPNQNLRGMDMIEVFSASNLTDAISSPKKMFEVRYDSSFKSPMVAKLRWGAEESHRDQTRFYFNLDDYATAHKANNSRIPTDGEICFLRVRGRMRATQELTELGPIVVVVPFDFFGITSPVFTVVGTAPTLGAVGIPDNLSNGSLNIHLPSFSQAIDVVNLSSVAGENLYVSCSAGMSPTIIPPNSSMSLNSTSVGEFFIAGDDSTPQFTLRCSVVNRG